MSPQPQVRPIQRTSDMQRLESDTREVVHEAFTTAGGVMLDALGWNPQFSGSVLLEFNNGKVCKAKPTFTL